ncbi:nitrate reductase [Streptomyces rimosus subsp. rimosus]|nr:nitrate reductase [Streptomyces rimosus subsp. rimosus]KOT44688.1 nitrate reductase [Streptomyces sp. NRRL WC-3701]KOT64714.1 nitrate reductase [Streptomyces rimosus subsp. rimosus]KOT66788.1 nitrate reductase [Streptomyces rimosus subsp. rimosus]KOT83473.1 nitrate reductase [Streptomyces rimosus subsp. rimosus]
MRSAVHQAASLLLSYPDGDWSVRLAAVAETMCPLPGEAPAALLRYCDHARGVPLLDLAACYVLTFDRSRRRTLHLTYYTDGDTRRRGAALARLKALYRTHGWQPSDGELPDYLPAVLEFAARCPEPGLRLLRDHRPAVELLGHALEKHRSPYADVLRAVRDTLPAPAAGDRAAALALARTGPPSENVGLDLFPADASAHSEGARR